MAQTVGDRLIGRSDDLQTLTQCLREAQAGGGRLVVVRGEAGIGKTRLCEAFMSAARELGAAVAWAACWEADSLPAYWPWSQLLDQLGATLPEPDEHAADPRLAMFESILALLRGAGGGAPVVLVIDDVQWADDASLRVLAFLAPLVKTMRAVVIVARRVDATVVQPERLDQIERHALTLSLPGLAADEVGALIESLTGSAAPDDTVAALHRVTAGNPLFASALIEQLERDNRLGALDGSGRIRLPANVRAVQAARLERLDTDAAAIVTTAACIGEDSDLALLAEVLDIEPPEVDAALNGLCDADVMRDLGAGHFAVSHPLLRAAAIESLTTSERLDRHRRIAEALERLRANGRSVDAATLAFHFLAAAPAGENSRAVHYAVEAGHASLARVAYAEATAFFQRALEALEREPEAGDRIATLLALATAQAADDPEASRATLLRVADEARAANRPADLARAGLGLAGSAGFEVDVFDDEQVALLEEALAVLPEHEHGLRSQCSARLAVALSITGSADRRAALTDDAVALARAAGDPMALAQALAAWCDSYAGPRHLDERLAAADEIIAMAKSIRDRAAELLGRRLRVEALFERGDLVGVEREIDAFAATARQLRLAAYEWYVPLWRASLAAARGDLEAAHELRRQARSVGAAAQSPNSEVLTMASEIMVSRQEGRSDVLVHRFDEWMQNEPGADYGVMFAGAFTMRHVALGEVDQARATYRRALPELASMTQDSEWLPLLGQFVELALELDVRDGLEWLYEALLPFEHVWAVEGIGAYTHGSTARFLGIVAALRGRTDAAADHFARALADNERAGATALVVRTREQQAAALGAAAVPRAVDEVVFEPEGDVWAVHYGGAVVRVRDSKGVRDLVRLVSQPGREVAAVDLAGGSEAPVQADLGETIDAQARDAYRQRLMAIAAELDTADARGDAARSAALASERDALVAALSGALGIGGKARRTGSTAERARTAVTARIRDAIRRIGAADAELGRHLSRSVRTGTFCVYEA